jgi:hypothetical protein
MISDFGLAAMAWRANPTHNPWIIADYRRGAASKFLQNTPSAQVRLKIGQGFRKAVQNNFFLIFGAVPIPPYQHGPPRALQKADDGFGLRGPCHRAR